MKYFLSFSLFLVSFLALLGVVSLFFNGMLFVALSCLCLLLTSFIFSNLHRFILMTLGAREIIDTDYQKLFQFVKSSTYSFGVKTPKVYSYKGNFKNFFVFESFNEWVIVLDRKLIDTEDKQVLSELISFIFNYHASGQGYLRTKVSGYLILYHFSLFKIIRSISSTTGSVHIAKAFSLFCLLLTRPATLLLEFFLKRCKKVLAQDAIKPLYLQKKESDSALLLFSHFRHSDLDPTKTIVKYAEAFPLLDCCEFS